MDRKETLHLLLILCLCIAVCTCKMCEINGPCSCSFDDGSGIVDLTSLGNTDGTPRFQDVPGQNDDNLYSYNPCGGFEEERGCTDAALCLLSNDKSEIQQLGKAASTMFKYDDDSGHVIAGYLSRGIALQYSEIEMICDANACEPEFVAIGRSSGEAAYKMQLTTICACAGMCTTTGPIKCSPDTPSSSAISVGSIFLIGLFACLMVYLVGGVLYNKIHKKATGSELIPNKEVWKSFPSFVAGGFKFLYSKCAPNRRGYTNSD